MDEFYRVPLTSSEALATLAVLRALDALLASGALPDSEIEPGILASAAERIAAEVPEFLGGRAEALCGSLVHDMLTELRPDGRAEDEDRVEPPFPVRRTRRLLEDAFERERPVEIEYFVQSRKQWTTRRVQISDVFRRDDAWYLSGHCEMRGDFRQFRLDHIRSVRVFDEDAAVPDPFVVE